MLLQQEAATIAGFGHDRKNITITGSSTSGTKAPGPGCTEFEAQTESLLQPLTPPEWGITDSELELLLKSKFVLLVFVCFGGGSPVCVLCVIFSFVHFFSSCDY